MTAEFGLPSLLFHTASRSDLLVESTDLASTMALHHALEAATLPGVRELIPAARTVLIRFDRRTTSAAELESAIRGLDLSHSTESEARAVTIDVVYDGEDLAEVAALLSISPAEVVRRHQAARWQVAFSGFAPGFGYLAGDDPLFRIPRRSSPRTRVPVGAVGLAGEFTGVYPRSSPGGWQLIGRTEAKLWDLDREPPALFVPGTIVTFRDLGAEAITTTPRTSTVEAGAGTIAAEAGTGTSTVEAGTGTSTVEAGAGTVAATDPGAQDESDAAAASDAVVTSEAVATSATPDDPADSAGEDATEAARSPAHGIEVVQPGLQLLTQDLGRPGFAALGVSGAGAADRGALRTANHLVGNREDAIGLESFGGGVTLRLTGAGVAAITGAQGPITLTSADGTVFTPRLGEAFATETGDELSLGAPTAGIRRYLAVRGGLDVAAVLDSGSVDTLAGLGPDPLSTGDIVTIRDPRTAPYLVPVSGPPIPGVSGQSGAPRQSGASSTADAPASASASGSSASVPTSLTSGSTTALPVPGEITTLSVTLGPREDWFTEAGIATFFDQIWTVTPDSDRVGLRLHGETPLERAQDGELPSEGAVTGALQVPPNGQPVLFGPDHPLTGGYPIIAGVDDTDLAAQLPPGARIRFVLGSDSTGEASAPREMADAPGSSAGLTPDRQPDATSVTGPITTSADTSSAPSATPPTARES